MSFGVGRLDPDERARLKQESRERDRARVQSGAISKAELRSENGFFSSLDVRAFKIVSVGGRVFAKAK